MLCGQQGLCHLFLSKNLALGPSLLETIGGHHRSTWNWEVGGLLQQREGRVPRLQAGPLGSVQPLGW